MQGYNISFGKLLEMYLNGNKSDVALTFKHYKPVRKDLFIAYIKTQYSLTYGNKMDILIYLLKSTY